LVNISARAEELAIDGFLNKDAHRVYQSICFDPLTSAVLSPMEIKNMVRDMFKANESYYSGFDISKL